MNNAYDLFVMMAGKEHDISALWVDGVLVYRVRFTGWLTYDIWPGGSIQHVEHVDPTLERKDGQR